MKRNLSGSRPPLRGGLGPLAGLLAACLCLLPAPAQAGPPKGAPGVPDKALQKAIDAAIEKGAAFLRAQQEQNGRIGQITHEGKAHYQIGTTALAGLALLAAGDQPAHLRQKKGKKAPVAEKIEVDRAMDFCRKQDDMAQKGTARTTYNTGTLLMFVSEYYKPQFDKKGRRVKHTVTKKEKDNPCKLPEDVSKWIRDMAMWLVSKQEEAGGWGYPDHREDLSNTQYAVLGLRAARDCGGFKSDRTFRKIIARLLATQEPDGPKVLRTLGGTKKGDTIYKIESGDRARGFGYLPEHRPQVATGSMTTAGIACLAISHDALSEPERSHLYDVKLENQVRRGIQDAFAWLDVNFSVTSNPPSGAPAWHYYYLYGLERAAMLAGRPLIGEHDWYLEGARYLVKAQKGNGAWSTGMLGGSEYKASDILDTAWAILFLKKATKPLKPIPGPVVTK